MRAALLIDDMDAVRETLAAILEALGYTVTATSSGTDGVRRAEGGGFDIVVTDIIMPDCDGNEVMRAVASMTDRPAILAVSGGGWVVEVDNALSFARCYADAVVQKPVTRDELARALDDAFSRPGTSNQASAQSAGTPAT